MTGETSKHSYYVVQLKNGDLWTDLEQGPNYGSYKHDGRYATPWSLRREPWRVILRNIETTDTVVAEAP